MLRAVTHIAAKLNGPSEKELASEAAPRCFSSVPWGGWWAPGTWKPQLGAMGCVVVISEPLLGMVGLGHSWAVLSLHPSGSSRFSSALLFSKQLSGREQGLGTALGCPVRLGDI